MRLVFSNLLYFLRTKSTFFYLQYELDLGVLRPVKNLKVSISKFYHYCLIFCQMMPLKSSFQTVLMIKALLLLQTCSQFDIKVLCPF